MGAGWAYLGPVLLFPLVPFTIGLALAADDALAIENGLNTVIVSDYGR